jgi:hypothetical protein
MRNTEEPSHSRPSECAASAIWYTSLAQRVRSGYPTTACETHAEGMRNTCGGHAKHGPPTPVHGTPHASLAQRVPHIGPTTARDTRPSDSCLLRTHCVVYKTTHKTHCIQHNESCVESCTRRRSKTATHGPPTPQSPSAAAPRRERFLHHGPVRGRSWSRRHGHGVTVTAASRSRRHGHGVTVTRPVTGSTVTNDRDGGHGRGWCGATVGGWPR